MKKEYLVYWLINDGNLLEDHPELICATQTSIDPNFDQKRLVFSRDGVGQDWPEDVSVFVSGTEPVDLLLCTPYIEIVSERAMKIIQEVAPDEVEFLPVKVFHEDGKPYMAMKYWAITIIPVVDALDWEHTTWIEPSHPSEDDPLAFLNVIKPCLYANKIERKHFFRVEITGEVSATKYVSRELKRKLEKGKCVVGIEFAPIKTT